MGLVRGFKIFIALLVASQPVVDNSAWAARRETPKQVHDEKKIATKPKNDPVRACELHLKLSQVFTKGDVTVKDIRACKKIAGEVKDHLRSSLKLCYEVYKIKADPKDLEKSCESLPLRSNLKKQLEELRRTARETFVENLEDKMKTYDNIAARAKKDPSCWEGDSSRFVDLMTELKNEMGFAKEDLENNKPKEREPSTKFGRFRRDANSFLDRHLGKGPLSHVNPMVKVLAMGIGSAVLWRWRGGGFFATRGATTVRLASIGLMSGLGYLFGGGDAAIAMALNYPTVTAPWAPWQTMGHQPGHTKLGDFLGMTGRGLFQTSLSSAYLWFRGYNPTGSIIGGAMMGPCYYAGWQTADGAKLGARLIGDRGFIDGATSVGELCTGATIGGGIMTSIVGGRDI